MKQSLKKALFAVAPEWTAALMAARSRAHSHRVIAGWGCGPLNRALVDRLGDQVVAGPFAGLALTPMTHAEQLGPYLLGVYESELDPAWDVVLRGEYPQVIDIGAKFGYYAVGLARRYPAAEVVAFDTDWWARRATRQVAAANGTGKVAVRGFCRPGWLARHAREGALVVSDCEGFEGELFTPAVVGRLRTAVLLVETHDGFVPGVTDRLRAALGGTHDLREYGDPAGRRGPDRDLGFLTAADRRLAEHEVRGPQRWLLGLPREGPHRALGGGA